jgi:DNA polymerase III subunit beta
MQNDQFFIQQNTLNAMLLLAGKKDIRYYLNGLHIEFAPEFTRVIACDGHKLGIYQAAAPDNRGYGSITIPRETIENLPKNAGLLEFAQIDANLWQLTAGSVSLKFAPCDSKYPDFRRVVDQANKTSGEAAGFNLEYLNQFEKCGNLLAGSKLKIGNRVRIHHNGHNGALITLNCVDNFAGIVMPLRDSVGSSGALFPADLISDIKPAADQLKAA